MRLPLRGFSLLRLHFPKLTPNFLLFPVLSTPTPFIGNTICYHNTHERIRRHPVIFLNRLLGASTMRRRGQRYPTSWLGPREKINESWPREWAVDPILRRYIFCIWNQDAGGNIYTWDRPWVTSLFSQNSFGTYTTRMWLCNTLVRDTR